MIHPIKNYRKKRNLHKAYKNVLRAWGADGGGLPL